MVEVEINWKFNLIFTCVVLFGMMLARLPWERLVTIVEVGIIIFLSLIGIDVVVSVTRSRRMR